MMFMIPFLFVVILTFLYLYLTPSQTNQSSGGMMNTIIESMQAIVPQGDYRIDEIKEYLTLIFKITEGIKKDKIACIVPTKDDINLIKKNTNIILPDSAAFGGGDATLGSKNFIKQKNPLLETVKEKERRIHELLNSIHLDLDVKGDKFKTRFMKKSLILKNEIDDMKNKVVSGCARQKIRLRNSHPHLSNYEFVDENTNNSMIPPSNYVHGKSVTPVGRDYNVEDSKLGLMQEFYSY
uniref:Uncharacterized protein n=1 Tax=viral metagenome TaxID=1070528 RepID=A0A6C0IY12_9ZZZZ